MKNGSRLRLCRIAFASLFFLLLTLSFQKDSLFASLPTLQLGPALVRVTQGWSIAAGALVLFFFITTLVFGRWFCAILCPLGLLQDGIDCLRPNHRALVGNLKWLRYCVALISYSLLISGWALGFRLLDPFSIFGAIPTSVTALGGFEGYALGGIISLTVFIALVLWKRRIFCTSLCPIGTVLGLCAKYGIFGMQLTASCVGCGRCATKCPTSCIDIPNRVVDNERCVLCLKCLSQCHKEGVEYSHKGRSPHEECMDVSRRRFIVHGTVVTAGAVMIGCGLGSQMRALTSSGAESNYILPPGAGNADRFDRICTRCQLCVASCPTQVIRPTFFGFGSVRIDFNAGRCDYECNKCGEVCPTGAIRSLSLEDKQWLRIGTASYDAHRCRVIKDNTLCDLCARACPKGAIFMDDGPNGPIPEVDTFHCIGCGACQEACPMQPKAITILAAKTQTFEESF